MPIDKEGNWPFAGLIKNTLEWNIIITLIKTLIQANTNSVIVANSPRVCIVQQLIAI